MGASKVKNVYKNHEEELDLWILDEYVDILQFEVHDNGSRSHVLGISVEKENIPALIKALQEAYK